MTLTATDGRNAVSQFDGSWNLKSIN